MTIRSRERKRSIHNEMIAKQCSMSNIVFDQRNHSDVPQLTTDRIQLTAQAALNDVSRPDWMKPRRR